MSAAASPNTLTVGTRGSLLARTQTVWVIDRIREANPGLEVRTEIISTRGDRQQGQPLPEIGGKGVFTEELEQALLEGSIDIAVHSAKDLPTRLSDGLGVLAWPVREDPRDAWVAAGAVAFDELPAGAVVGTSSLRRQAQLLARRPDLQFVSLRGNIDTRIRKVQRGDCAGAVLAMAGLKRASLVAEVTHPFEIDVCLPAPGQGALAIEGRAGDARVVALLAPLNDAATQASVSCERAVLDALDAGCKAPVAVLATVANNTLSCRALVADPRGQQTIRAASQSPADQPLKAAAAVVEQLRAGGAEAIIAACRL